MGLNLNSGSLEFESAVKQYVLYIQVCVFFLKSYCYIVMAELKLRMAD